MHVSIVLDDDLVAEARRLTGLEETESLIREALKELIARERGQPAGAAWQRRSKGKSATVATALTHYVA